jgi:hypothetical protein
MELQIKDRLYIPALLPKEGNFKQFHLKKDILKKIEISEEERERVELTQNQENKRIEWNTKKDTPLSVRFSADEMEFLKQSCEKISDEALPDDMWATVEKIYDGVNG